jgi:hypothetical protein
MTTEKKTFIKYRSALNSLGMANRIETPTLGGFPDIVFLYKGQTIFIEQKEAHGDHIYLEPYQIAWHTRAMQILQSSHDWFWIERKGLISCSKWVNLRDAPRIIQGGKVKLDILDRPPSYVIATPDGVKDWLEKIHEL